jgi:hypothetical protein
MARAEMAILNLTTYRRSGDVFRHERWVVNHLTICILGPRGRRLSSGNMHTIRGVSSTPEASRLLCGFESLLDKQCHVPTLVRT